MRSRMPAETNQLRDEVAATDIVDLLGSVLGLP